MSILHKSTWGIAALLTTACASSPALAQKITPGLWEHTSTMSMQGADGSSTDANARMQQQMASLPPDQRKMMEEMMAKQGIGMGAKPNTVRVCVSPEQAARGDVPADDSRCKREMLARSGSTLRFKFSCDGPPSSTGEGEYSLASDKAYTMKMKVTTGGGDNKGDSKSGSKSGSKGGKAGDAPGSMEMQGSGRWIATDCGSLKPRP